MNPLWLWLIVPFSAWLGALLMALVFANDGGYINLERFNGTTKNFAEHLRNAGEEKAAEAVETVLKSVNAGIFNDGKTEKQKKGRDNNGSKNLSKGD